MFTITKKIIDSGGSSLLVLPAEIIGKWGNPKEVDLQLDDDHIIITPHKNVDKLKGA